MRLHTSDPLHQLAGVTNTRRRAIRAIMLERAGVTNTRRRAIRAIMLERLTEIMYRRVALLYGFDGPAMTERKVASVEGVNQFAVQKSRDAAFVRMAGDWRLWALWLTYGFGKYFGVVDSPRMQESEAGGASELWEGMGDAAHRSGQWGKQSGSEAQEELAPATQGVWNPHHLDVLFSGLTAWVRWSHDKELLPPRGTGETPVELWQRVTSQLSDPRNPGDPLRARATVSPWRDEKSRYDIKTGGHRPVHGRLRAPPGKTLELPRDGIGSVTIRPSGTTWESDAGTAPTTAEAYTDGWIAAREGEEMNSPYRREDLREAWEAGYVSAS